MPMIPPRISRVFTFVKEWGWVGSGALAAVAFAISVLSANYTRQGVELQRETYDLEARPQLALACGNDFMPRTRRGPPLASGKPPPSLTFFLRSGGMSQTRFAGEEVYLDGPRLIYIPNLYERCVVKNTGRTAAAGVVLRAKAQFESAEQRLYIGDLPRDGHVDFTIINGEQQQTLVQFKALAETTDLGLDVNPRPGPCSDPVTRANENGHCRPLTIDPPVPIELPASSIFVLSKSTQERYLKRFYHDHGLPISCLNTANICLQPNYQSGPQTETQGKSL